eukprot:3703007-Amphidinium_carterae.1
MKVRPEDRSAFEARRLLPVARAVAPFFPSAESLSSSPRIRISPGRVSRMRSEVLITPRRWTLAGLAPLLATV